MANLNRKLIQLVEEKELDYQLIFVSHLAFKEQKIEEELILLEPSLQIYEGEKVKSGQVTVLDPFAYVTQDEELVLEQIRHHSKKASNKQQIDKGFNCLEGCEIA